MGYEAARTGRFGAITGMTPQPSNMDMLMGGAVSAGSAYAGG